MHSYKKKTNGVCVCLLCLCVVGTAFVSLYGDMKWRCLCPRLSVCAVCLSVFVCVCVCVRPIVYVCKKKTMGVCVSLLCTCVLWGPSL